MKKRVNWTKHAGRGAQKYKGGGGYISTSIQSPVMSLHTARVLLLITAYMAYLL